MNIHVRLGFMDRETDTPGKGYGRRMFLERFARSNRF